MVNGNTWRLTVRKLKINNLSGLPAVKLIRLQIRVTNQLTLVNHPHQQAKVCAMRARESSLSLSTRPGDDARFPMQHCPLKLRCLYIIIYVGSRRQEQISLALVDSSFQLSFHKSPDHGSGDSGL